MTIAFWVVSGLAALPFFVAGLTKLVRPLPKLKESGMGWMEDFSPATVRLIALAEVLGAIGLVVPPLTGIAPLLSPIAGLCLAVIMGGAVVVHIRRREPPAVAIFLTILPIAAATLGFVTLR